MNEVNKMLLDLIMGILGLGFSLIAMILRIVLVLIVAGIAGYKRRNPLLWGAATLFFPWIFFVVLFIPKRYPRFSGSLSGEEAFRGKNPVIASIMALSAMIAKSDGSISKEEISFIRKFISSHFGIYGEELDSYADAFNYGKTHPEAYKEFTSILKSYYVRRDVIIAIAYLFVSIAMQESEMNSNTDQLIRKILIELGISEYEYISIKNSFTHNYNYYSHQGSQATSASQSDLVKKYCKVLGVGEDASMTDIKKAYRKLVKEYHPDKLASESMPKEYEEFAKKKIIEINEAYEYLKKIKEA